MPSMILADAKNGRRHSNSDPVFRPDKFHLFKELGFPGSKAQIDPMAIASFAKVSLSGFMPRWISEIVPRMEWLDAASVSNVVAPDKDYALLSPHLAVFNPKVEGQWLTAPLLVFNFGDWQVGKEIELVDFDTENPVMTVVMPEQGTGYMTDVQLLIVSMA
jgi:hypothetical protein